MRIIDPAFEIIDYSNLIGTIELAGRVCWKSEDKITPGSAEPFIQKIKGYKHDSVLEHGSISVRFICDRGVSHEFVRHRLASFSQESTRYCNYSKGKFGSELTFIRPHTGLTEEQMQSWERSMAFSEEEYMTMIELGCSAQQARAVLPVSLKTEIVITANPREWRHILKLRCSRDAHPDMRYLMLQVQNEFASKWPVLFGDTL